MLSPEKIKAMKRVEEEFKDLSNNPILNIGAQVGLPNEDNIMEWRCTLVGPQDSNYANGLFFLKAKFPDNYPNSRPEVSFITPIYHINVNPKAPKSKDGECLGHVCISTLNWWKPTSNMKEVLHDIFALFYMANPKSPYGLDRAEEFLKSKDLHDQKCKFFTQKYASMNSEMKEFTNDWDFTYNP